MIDDRLGYIDLCITALHVILAKLCGQLKESTCRVRHKVVIELEESCLSGAWAHPVLSAKTSFS